MSCDVVDTRILNILTQVSRVPVGDIGLEDRLREDLGLDSVGSMELLSMMSEQLGIELELEDALEIRTVGEIQALIDAHHVP